MTQQAPGPAGRSPIDPAQGDPAQTDPAPQDPVQGDPAVDTAIKTLEQQLSMLWRRARADSHKVARQVHPEMEPAAYGLMVILQREGSIRLTHLAAAIGVGKPSVSRQVALLEQLGLVRKDADPLDGRAQAISLTEEGVAKLQSAQCARYKAFHRLMADWELEDLRHLGRLLGRLNDTYGPQ